MSAVSTHRVEGPAWTSRKSGGDQAQGTGLVTLARDSEETRVKMGDRMVYGLRGGTEGRDGVAEAAPPAQAPESLGGLSPPPPSLP